MRPVSAVLAAIALFTFAALVGCQKQAPPETGGAAAVGPGRAHEGQGAKGAEGAKMTAPGGGESSAGEGTSGGAPAAGSLQQTMKDVMSPNYSALAKAVRSGDLAAAKPATEKLLEAAEKLDKAAGAPVEREALDNFIGYRDDLVAAADNLLAALKSGDAAAATAGAQDLGKACGACHKEFRRARG